MSETTIIICVINLVWIVYWMITGKITTANQLTGIPRVMDGCLVLGFALIWRFCSGDDRRIEMLIGVVAGAVVGFVVFIAANFTNHALLISTIALALLLLGVFLTFTTSLSVRTPSSSPGGYAVIGQEGVVAGFIPGCWLAYGLTLGLVAGCLVLLPFVLILLVLWIASVVAAYYPRACNCLRED